MIHLSHWKWKVKVKAPNTQRYSAGIGIRPTFILPRVPVLQGSQSVNRQSVLEYLSHVNTYGKQNLQKKLSMILFSSEIKECTGRSNGNEVP